MDNKAIVKIQVIMLKNQMITGSKCPSCGEKKMITEFSRTQESCFVENVDL